MVPQKLLVFLFLINIFFFGRSSKSSNNTTTFVVKEEENANNKWQFKSLKAYVVTQNPEGARYKHTSSLLNAIGLFNGKAINVGIKSNNTQIQGCAALKVHRDAWFTFRGEYGRADEWALFFEDDIQLHPSLNYSTAKVLLYELFSTLNDNSHFSRGFLYLGICAGLGDHRSPLYTNYTFTYAQACGYCLHAYAVRRDAIDNLWSNMKRASTLPINDTHWQYTNCENLDLLLRRYCEDPSVKIYSNTSGFPVIEPMAQSPDSPGNQHYGVFYQWRSHFRSLISNNEIDPPA